LFRHPQAGALTALGAAKNPLHRNELLVWQQDWGVKHHPALLAWLPLNPALKHDAKGITTHGALLLVLKQLVASGP
jgi:hypothetical protein